MGDAGSPASDLVRHAAARVRVCVRVCGRKVERKEVRREGWKECAQLFQSMRTGGKNERIRSRWVPGGGVG